MEEDSDIKTLQEILSHKQRGDIAGLLTECTSEISQSTQYGSHWNSFIASFIIRAPVKQFYALKALSEDDKQLLKDSVIEIYPLEEDGLEIVTVEYKLLRNTVKDVASPVEKMSAKSDVQIFVSYSTLDKQIAGSVKETLANAGFTVFLAHEDIMPSSEWVEVILDNLNSSDIFIPLITTNFKESDWTAQEAGFALSKGTLIIPVSIDGRMPFGFISRFQALKIDSMYIARDAKQIVDTILERAQTLPFKYRLVNSIIAKFSASDGWGQAGDLAILLEKLIEPDVEQINKIFESAAANYEIYKSFRARSSIERLYEKYEDKISEPVKEKLREEFPSLFPAPVDVADGKDE